MDEALCRVVRDRAIALVARREHSMQEIRTKLLQRNYPSDVVEQVVADLVADDLISESRFAEVFVHARRNRGYGPLRIQAELRQRGVSDRLARDALDAAEEDWRRLAGAARRKRFGNAVPGKLRERRRQYRFLAGRGFTGEQIRAALESESDE